MSYISIDLLSSMLFSLLGSGLLVVSLLSFILLALLASKGATHPAIVLPILGIMWIMFIVNPKDTNFIELPAWIAFPIFMFFGVFAFFAIWDIFFSDR